MSVTLTELNRSAGQIVRNAVHGKQELVVTVHGKPFAKILPVKKTDRKKVLACLLRMKGLEIPER